MPDSDTLNLIATSPIAADAPCGASARYDEAYAALESELAKLENPAGGEVDWRAVEDGSAELLSRTSKDVLVAAWLARAMWQRGSMAGLASGLETLRRMLETFWDGLYPQRIRPRRAALEWLSEKLAGVLPAEQLAGDPAATARSLAEIDAIIAWAGDRFEGEDCGLLALRGRLNEASAGAPAADAAPADDGGAAADPAAGGTARVRGPAGPIAGRAQAVERLKELHAWWSQHEPSSPMVPLLKRAVIWSDLDFPTLFAILLRNRSDAKDYMWDVLGMNDDQPLN